MLRFSGLINVFRHSLAVFGSIEVYKEETSDCNNVTAA